MGLQFYVRETLNRKVSSPMDLVPTLSLIGNLAALIADAFQVWKIVARGPSKIYLITFAAGRADDIIGLSKFILHLKRGRAPAKGKGVRGWGLGVGWQERGGSWLSFPPCA